MFWMPTSYDYGSTGNRPPIDLGLKSALDLQNARQQNQLELQQQQYGFEGQQNALSRALQANMQGAQLGWQGQQNELNRGFQGQQSALDRALQQSMQSAQFGFQGQQNELNRNFQGQQSGADRELQRYLQGTQLGFQGNQASLDRQQAKDLQSSQLATQMSIARLPIDFQREKFGQLFPLVSSAIGGAMGGGGMGGAAGSSGASFGGGSAQMAPGTVYTPGQIDQQVNAMKAGNNQAAATQQRQNAAATAAGGFGGHSPLLAALNNQAQMGAMQANTSGERDTRLAAAAANAKQGLGAAQANNQANIGFQQNAIDAQRNQLNARTSLIAALAGML